MSLYFHVRFYMNPCVVVSIMYTDVSKNSINFTFSKCCINVMTGFISYLPFAPGLSSLSTFKEKAIRSDNELAL